MVSYLDPEIKIQKVTHTVSYYVVSPLEISRYDMFNVMVYLHDQWYIASSVTVFEDRITLRPCRYTTGFFKDIVKSLYLTLVGGFTIIALYKIIESL